LKVQYFGDEHDFRKYALLRKLAGVGGFRVGVCWMLTPNDGGADGGKRAYLDAGQGNRWRLFDSELYDLLAPVSKDSLSKAQLANPTCSHFLSIQRKLIEGAVYFNNYLTRHTRQEIGNSVRFYFERVANDFSEANPDFVFFDPDNGLEVQAFSITSARAEKYLYFEEAKKIFSSGKSLVVYQHFPFIPRDVFVPLIKRQLSACLDGCAVQAFETPNVLFLAAVHPEHESRLQQVVDFVAKDWPRQRNFVWVSERPHSLNIAEQAAI
jgi:hypothetical protein